MGNKYTVLVKNTVIFALGTFGSKALVFLLMPFYTRVLAPDEYGVIELITSTANLMIPFVCVCINDAIIRFGLDKAVDKSDVFSTGIWTVFWGFCAFLLLVPAFLKIKLISAYTALIYAYVLASCLNNVCHQFARACGKTKLFAYAGFQNTATVALLNIVFLLFFKWGITGYILSIVFADAITGIFIFTVAKQWRSLKFKGIDGKVSKSMLLFSLPLIPNALFWWITNVSDRYLVSAFLGTYENGIYAVAYKIPTILTLMSTIFMQAWQLSAISEYTSSERGSFYGRVFYMYQALVFSTGSLIVAFSEVLTRLLVSEKYFDSRRFVPILIMAFVFQCFASFWATIYMAAKRNKVTMLTTFAGAAINIALNLIFLPRWGAVAAAIATAVSYFAVFAIRVIDSRRFIKIDFRPARFLLNFALTTAQCAIMVSHIKGVYIYQTAIAAAVLLVNLKPLLSKLSMLGQGLQRLKSSKNSDSA